MIIIYFLFIGEKLNSNTPNLSDIHFEPFDNERLAKLRGKHDENIRHIEQNFRSCN